MSQLKADDQALIAMSINDPEAFFMFLAHSIEDHGELITPLDIEELEISETKDNETDQEEIIQ